MTGNFSGVSCLRTMPFFKENTCMSSLFVISAPSGAGKTSLVHAALAKDNALTLSISHTTRAQREGEIDGEDYFFISTEQFKAMQAEQAFLESAEVFTNFYGTSKNSINDLLDSGKDVILEIDWQGAEQIKQFMPAAIAITILPPSRQALEDRLRQRQQDDEATIQKRMQAAAAEMSHYNKSDYLIINDNFEVALQQLLSIFQSQRLRCKIQAEHHAALIKDLLK